MGNFVHHVYGGRHEVFFAIGTARQRGLTDFHTAQLLQKIKMEIGAAELAIGDGFEAHVFLEFHNLADGFVFHQAQGFARDAALGFLIARLQQIFGAQKATHMVVAGGKLGVCHEGSWVSRILCNR